MDFQLELAVSPSWDVLLETSSRMTEATGDRAWSPDIAKELIETS